MRGRGGKQEQAQGGKDAWVSCLRELRRLPLPLHCACELPARLLVCLPACLHPQAPRPL